MIDSELTLSYLNAVSSPKLHLGCGSVLLGGWLNTDISSYSRGSEIVHLDAGKPFDLPSDAFDFVYSEHLFEHLTYTQSQIMLSECHRVLKTGGIMRLATPDLAFLLNLYEQPNDPLNRAYIVYISKLYGLPPSPIYAINNFHTNWGHKIIYDFDTLRNQLTKAGFVDVKKCEVGVSAHPELNDIEHHYLHFTQHGYPGEFNKLQTLVVEATK